MNVNTIFVYFYEKYNKLFPNVTIKYNKDNVTPAKKVIFYNNDVKADAGVFYEVFTDGNQTIEYLTSAQGPNGTAIGEKPAKPETNENSYVFAEKWMLGNVEYTTETIKSFKPTADLTEFYPVYTTVPRKYSIKFYNYDTTAYIDEEKAWNEKYSVPNFLYRDSSDLDIYERWTFKGWSINNYGEANHPNPVYLDTSNLVVTGNLTAYAHFVKEDVRTNPTKEEYFDFVETVVETFDGNMSNPQRNHYGYAINIKEEYRKILEGKITLPKLYNKQPVIKVGDFANASKITHVFFEDEKNSNYIEFGRECFKFIESVPAISESGNEYFVDRSAPHALVAVYAPSSIKNIGDHAFQGVLKLETFQWNNGILKIGDHSFAQVAGDSVNAVGVTLNELPESLIYIGANAFYMNTKNVTVTKIPPHLEELGGFALCGDNVIITDFNNSLKRINSYALYNAGSNIKDNIIYIRKNVEFIGQYAFGTGSSLCYGNGKIQHVNFENPESAYHLNASEMGFDLTRTNVVFGATEETEVIA